MWMSILQRQTAYMAATKRLLCAHLCFALACSVALSHTTRRLRHAGKEASPPSSVDGPRSSHRNFLGNMTHESFTSAQALLGVFSSGRDVKFANRRSLIRNTWGAFLGGTKLQLLFVISIRGLSKDALDALNDEASETNDLLLLRDDVYGGKKGTRMLEFFEWARVNKPDMDYVVKIDEDVWMHTYQFQRLLVSLPRNWQYWGLLRQGPENVRYVASWLVVLSRDMLNQLYLKRVYTDVLLSTSSTSNSSNIPASALLLGQVIQHTPITINMLEAYPAANYELYDWGPDKDPDLACEEADDGQPPSETLAVHALRRTVDFTLMHSYHVGSLLRWRACTQNQFEDPPRCQRVLNWELNIG